MTKIKGDIHAHYFVQIPEEEDEELMPRAHPSILMLEAPLRIANLQEGIVKDISKEDEEYVLTIHVNGERIEGRRAPLQSLERTPIEQDAPVNEEVPSKDKAMVEVSRTLILILIQEFIFPTLKQGRL